MHLVADQCTRDITCSRLKLAGELIFTPQVHDDDIYYHIEFPSRGVFYRVGYSEYFFLSLLDGETTVAQALTLTARQLGAEALTKEEGIQVANWLLENGLAGDQDQDGSSVSGPAERRTGLLRQLNPFWTKLPLGSPDRLLSNLQRPLGWLFSFWAVIAGLSIILVGASCLASDWDKFSADARTVLAPHNWLWLALAWLGLKIVHELAHAVACKSYGGEVRETGIILVLFAPMAYVDVTSCWRFPSKWQRIHVAAAGMYVELVLAAVAAIFWSRVDSPAVAHWLYNVIVMATLSTLLFNANPLMRFDGYYILADLLEIPNLGSEGSRFVKLLANRIFYGSRMRQTERVGCRLWCVRIYGAASAVWRVLICVSLSAAASVLMHGAGVLLALLGMLGWFGRPLWNVSTDLLRRLHESPVTFARALCVGTTLGAMLVIACTQLPWPGAMTAPAIVDYAELSIVRSRTSGFVTRVCVDNGERVSEGQLLMELTNRELTTEQRQLELSLEEERVRRRMALDEQKAAEVQVADRNLQAIGERLEEVRRQTDGLRVLAPAQGRILMRNLKQRVGSYVREGTELLTIGDEQHKELIVSVGQEEVDTVAPLVGETARFRVGGCGTYQGQLQQLEPRASTEIPHPAMSATAGGPLAAVESNDSENSKLRLAEPRFRGVIRLDPLVAGHLGAGQRGYATLGLRKESAGEILRIRFSRWLESLLTPRNE